MAEAESSNMPLANKIAPTKGVGCMAYFGINRLSLYLAYFAQFVQEKRKLLRR